MPPHQLAMRKWSTTKCAGIAALSTATVIAATVYAVGFRPGGVRGGSFAAMWQSRKGNIERGSIFSTLQSAGAGGAGVFVVYGIPATGAAAVTFGVRRRASISPATRCWSVRR
ncbi:hypothetical protein E8E11_005864 [Didymella keratinophila]|nr:hypothetical protein E8E11_005864 [Didymella keratinophila]